MKNLAIFGTIALVLLSGRGFAQNFASRFPASYSNPEQLDSLLASLADRAKTLPTGEYQVYSELRWIDDQLASIANSLARDRPVGDTDKNLRAIKQQWSETKTNLLAIKVDDFPSLLEFLENKYHSIIGAAESITFRRDLEDTVAYRDFEAIVGKPPLKKLFNRGEYVAPQKEQSTNIVQALQQKFVPAFDSFLDEIDRQTRSETVKQEQLKEKLGKAQTELQSYRQKILDQRQKAETKKSLGTNLYLMILVIGSLSIGAIALVRWFPDNVMMEWVESGQVIQFVTVMILLSVIMALGLAGLLTENTLGTLLGGVGGYVLSQGVGRSAARRAVREMNNQQPDNNAGGRAQGI